jgi:pimeloyl-ACP methyl ester carboxylesterase
MLIMMLRSLTDSMLFYPERGQWRTPAALGLKFEELWIDVQGSRVQSWWIPGSGNGPVILMFHGNAGTIADRLENARLMIDELGATVVLAEYPGYGDSEGRPSEDSFFAAGRLALEETIGRAGGRPVVLFGRSLGGAVAVHLAADPELPIDALVIEAAFTNLAELGRTLGLPVAAPLLPYRFDSLASIPRVTVPILILHGDRDEVVPFSMGERLFAAARGAEVRRFSRIDGAGHNDTLLVGGSGYWRTWREFLVELD